MQTLLVAGDGAVKISEVLKLAAKLPLALAWELAKGFLAGPLLNCSSPLLCSRSWPRKFGKSSTVTWMW